MKFRGIFMKKIFLIALICCSLLVTTIGCTKKEAPATQTAAMPDIDFGTLDAKNLYENKQFSMTMQLPESWKALTPDEIMQALPYSNVTPEEGQPEVFTLFFATSPKSEGEDTIGTITILAETLGEITDETEYLEMAKRQLESIQKEQGMERQMEMSNVKTVKLGNKNFYCVTTTTLIDGAANVVDHYMLKIGDYFFQISTTYNGVKQEEDIKNIITSIQFKN